ncbi:hypothetical protein ACLM5J_18195 [Nocardioides sp. Bht2]|uniref:hypothetical protein n=1 Tax=Nocardioides sp. Bht2 TaxID=3392297 RepID=UPI0039B6DCF2
MTTPTPYPVPSHEPVLAAPRVRRRSTLGCAGLALGWSAVLYLVAALWWVEASNSDSSTAAIGLLFALVLAVLATGPALLAALALVLYARSSRAAHAWAVAALCGHGFLLGLAAMIWLPSVF